MSLEQKVMENLKQAMKDKDEAALRTLRAIKGELLKAKTEKNAQEIDEAKEVDILQKMAKQRKESLDIYIQQQKEDLAQAEREELEIIQSFLPEQLSEEEIKPVIKKIIQEQNATGMKDMGKVIGIASAELKGKTDNATISKVAKELLTNS